jgi:hypothetical protein
MSQKKHLLLPMHGSKQANHLLSGALILAEFEEFVFFSFSSRSVLHLFTQNQADGRERRWARLGVACAPSRLEDEPRNGGYGGLFCAYLLCA